MATAMSGTDSSTPREGADTPEAPPDLSRYSAEELRQLLQSELSRRESDGKPEPGAAPVPGRFSRRDGFAGWLESVRRRQQLYGRGSISATADTVTIRGWQRTWLGVPVERAEPIAAHRVRNVTLVATGIYLEVARRGWVSRKLVFEPDPGADVDGLLTRLPSTKTLSFTSKRQDLLLFEQTLRATCPVAWVTPVLVLLNIAAFVALTVAAGTLVGLFGFNPITLDYANASAFVLGGEPWRLATALFVHANLLHLALNMWALWSVGRLMERLYGRSRYLSIYLLAGLIAGLASIAWNPGTWSVGASGAIFGVFGAFVAYLVHPATHVPRAIMRAHWVPTLLFVAFNLVVGAVQQGVDNAAHVGGLLAGCILGVALIRVPIDTRRPMLWSTRLAALAILIGGTATALYLGNAFDRERSLAEEFAVDHPWYAPGETRNLVAWQRLAGQAAAGMISDAQFADGFRTEVQPFWEDTHARLLDGPPGETEGERRYRLAIAEYAQLRLDWIKALLDMVNRDASAAQRAAGLMEEVNKRVARLERMALISQAGSNNGGLSRLQPFVMIRSAFSRATRECVRSPYVNVINVAETDSRTDLPYLNDAAACRAQQLFVAGDYRELENSFEVAGTNSDFAGDTSMAPLRAGLLRLFQFGPHSIEANLQRLVEWRRAVPGSKFVGPLEADLFSTWAWQARGTGFARDITQQAWAIYAYRTEMARASLAAEDEAATGARSALWYQAWFDISIGSSDRDELLAKFAEAQALYPDYYALHSGVIRHLLPRWGGSHADVVAFINGQVREAPESEQDVHYARLMWIYVDMEGDEANFMRDVGFTRWQRFQRAFAVLLERYPDSDYLLNSFARLSCLADAATDYRRLRPQLDSRKSATAWTLKTTLEACDEQFSGRP